MDVELSDTGHGLGAELDQVAAGRGHDGKPGEIGQGFLAPAELMSGPQGLDLAEHGAVGLGLGRGAGLSAVGTSLVRLLACRSLGGRRLTLALGQSSRTGPRPGASRS